MGVDHSNHDVLATWKEIAAYLKTSVRTCLRWEAQSGLPVHRQEGAPKSRVYAYKDELDAWFKARLTNGSVIQPKSRGGFLKRNLRQILASLSLAGLLLTAYWLFVGQTDAQKKVPFSDVPASTGPLESHAGDIVTSEFAAAGRLRVWRKKSDHSYFETWRIEPVRHTSLAVGNLDADERQEIVAPGHCREFEEVEGRTTTKIRFFLNVYKHAYKDWWQTTFYDFSQCVFEKDNFEFTEIAIGDVDGLPGNEIILITAHGLSVFKYDAAEDRIKLLAVLHPLSDEPRLLLRALCVRDLDESAGAEILILANEGEEGNVAQNRGWLLICEMTGARLEVLEKVMIDGNTSIHSLGVGDIIPGGPVEAVFPSYREESGVRTAFINIWDRGKGIIFTKPVSEGREVLPRPVHLAVGQLFDDARDDILLGKANPDELVTFRWSDGDLVPGPKIGLDHRIEISQVLVDDSGRAAERQSRVLVCGRADMPDTSGKFYLGLYAFTDGFVPLWSRLGGDAGDLAVTSAGFVRKSGS